MALNSTQLAALTSEINTDPLARGYSPFIAACPGVLVEMLNAQTYSAPKSTFVTARRILEVYAAAGAAILDKLDAAGASVSVVKWAMKFMMTDGIDAGSPTTRSLLDQLVTNGILLQTEADQLKNLALQPASRADVLGLPTIAEADVRSALNL